MNTKMTPHQHQQMLKNQIYGSYNQPAAPLQKSQEEKPLTEEEKEKNKELIDEHKNLVNVLESPSHEDDKKEAVKQKEELEELEEKNK